MATTEGASMARIPQDNVFSGDFLDGSLKSLATASEGAQAIAAEATAFSNRTVEAGTAAIENLLHATSFDAAVDIQSRYARSAYESFVAQTTRMTALYADLARDAYKPLEAIVATRRS